MAQQSALGFLANLFKDERLLMNYMSYLFLFWGCCTLSSLLNVTAPYGRYSRSGWGTNVPVKWAWIIQELPSFVVPLLVAFFTTCVKTNTPINVFILGLFLLHYFQRTFIFPFLIQGGKPTPMVPFVMAIIFCCLNGYLQSANLLKFADIELSPGTYPRIALGVIMFFSGFLINIHSDHVLRNLRKPGETGYKIPKGGMFRYVSGANFFGESLEWWGFAVASWTLPAFAFAVFTSFNIGPRAFHHHRWYKQKFDNYPKDRKAFIPFIL